jgi:hypothetical protein
VGGAVRAEQEVVDYTTNASFVAGLEANASTGSGVKNILDGVVLTVRTGALTRGFVGGVLLPAASASGSYDLTGCYFDDAAGSGGDQRGAIARRGLALVTGTPVVRVNGGRMAPYVGPLNGSAATFLSKEPNQIVGGATLASGVARVLLITDAGNGGGAADCSFTSGGTSVSTATDLTATYRIGDYIRAASHDDSAWTQIKNTSSTTITLVEGYRGATLATTQGKRGTPNDNTQPDGSYRVNVTAAITGETFGVTLKHASGFLITSSNAASTATVDWILAR